MKFVLLVEGHTERKAVPEFLKRWLDQRLPQPIGIKTIRFDGWQQLYKDVEQKTRLVLDAPNNDVVAVIALLDLYGPTFYPADKISAADRYAWAKQAIEQRVGDSRFRQYFAVHKLEAWLLSNPSIFPVEIRPAIKLISNPESKNFDEPPAKLLDNLYSTRLNRNFAKITHGTNLFRQLDPSDAASKCPYLAGMLYDMLQLAQGAQRPA